MTATPQQDPCRGPDKTLDEDISGAAAKPAPAKVPPSFPCNCQPSQPGEHLRGDVWPRDQLSEHLRGGMQIFVETLPPHQLSSQLASMALPTSSVRKRVEAKRGGDSWDELPSRTQ